MSVNLASKTQLYHQLHVGMKAALPLDVLLQSRMLPDAYAKHGAALQLDIQKGRPLSTALAARKLIAPWEAKLLTIGEAAGKIEAVLLDLELFFESRSRQLRELKSRLRYPLIVVLFSFVLPSLPQVVDGSLNQGAYLLLTLTKIFLLYLAYQLLVVKPFEKSGGAAFNPLLLKSLAVVGPTHLLREIFETSYLNLLTLCLDSGLDVAETLKLLRDTATNKHYRHQHQRALANVQKHGLGLTQVLSAQGILKHPQIGSFLHSSEQSGTLHSALRDFVARKRVELNARINHLLGRGSQWFYIAVMLYAALGIV